MKIQEIEFENFRNFKDHGSILCSTDGKVTIIYGKNGEGKTTLQQLCQWIFYGEVNFNRTTTDKLYNLAYEDTLGYGDVFKVMGRIHFTQMGTNYMLTREVNYKKGLTDSAKMNEEVSLLKEDNDHNWISVPKAEEVIEMLLPSGLKEYFFFDGESMIADLRVKGRDSANKLRKALYSMFDLDDYERASEHIGDTSKKTTVLGRLYLEKAGAHPTGNLGAIKVNIENAQQSIQKREEQKGKKEEVKKDKERFIKESSERIGKALSQEQYEQQRKSQEQLRDGFLSSIKGELGYFGRDMEEGFPKYLLAKRIMDAKEKLRLKVDREKLTPGVSSP